MIEPITIISVCSKILHSVRVPTAYQAHPTPSFLEDSRQRLRAKLLMVLDRVLPGSEKAGARNTYKPLVNACLCFVGVVPLTADAVLWFD